MKNFSRKAFALAMTAALTVSMAACGSKDSSDNTSSSRTANSTAAVSTADTAQNKVSLVLSTNWGEGDSKYNYFYPKFQEFQNANKDSMDISFETYSTEDYKTKIKTQISSGNLPDAFTYWGGAMMNVMVEAGLLLDVDEYFKASQTVKRENFEPSSFSYYTAADGKTYGVPLESTRGVFLVNTEIFKQNGLTVPKTYDELKQVSKVLNDKGIIPIAMASSGGTPSEFFFSELYNQYNGAADELKNLTASRKFNTANAVKVAANIQDMINNKMFPKDTVANGGWASCLQLYTDKKAAMTYTYPWMFESIPEEIQKISEVVPVPKLPDADIDPATLMSGFTVYGFEINKATFNDPEKHDALIKLCDFLASDDLSINLSKSGMIPAKKVNVDMNGQKVIYQKMMAYAADKKLIQVHFSTMPSLDALNMFDSSLDELFIKALEPQAFVDKIQAVLDKNSK